MGTEGYIKLHRKTLLNDMFLELPFDRWRAFEFLMLNAKYKPTDVILKGNIVHLNVGQMIFGEENLAKRWGWSRGKVHRFLSQLANLGMIQYHGTPYGTVITIENYAMYQCDGTADGTVSWTADSTADSTADGTADGTATNVEKYTFQRCSDIVDNEVTHPKHQKNGTHIKNKEIRNNNNRAFKPPLVDDVKRYCLERGNSVDAEVFVDFYESKGWMVGKNKMKDWKAAVRTWEKNRSIRDKQGTTQDWERELMEGANGKK